MIEKLLNERLDMVVASALIRTWQPIHGHRFGNRMLTGFPSSVFGQAFKKSFQAAAYSRGAPLNHSPYFQSVSRSRPN
jgi:hypothetical protein